MPYLRGKGLLDTVKNSTSILRLTLSEIIEREFYIREINEPIVTPNNTFHPIFGWTKKKFEEKKKERKETTYQ